MQIADTFHISHLHFASGLYCLKFLFIKAVCSGSFDCRRTFCIEVSLFKTHNAKVITTTLHLCRETIKLSHAFHLISTVISEYINEHRLQM